MEKIGAAMAVEGNPKANGLIAYLVNNLRAQGRLPRKTILGYLAAWGVWALILWGLDLSAVVPTYPAKAVLAIIVWACIIWVTEAVPVGVSGLMIPMLLVVTKAVPQIPQAFGGFVLDVSFMTIGAFIFAAILCAATLDTRIALTVLAKLKASRVSRIIIGLFTLICSYRWSCPRPMPDQPRSCPLSTVSIISSVIRRKRATPKKLSPSPVSSMPLWWAVSCSSPPISPMSSK